MTEHYDILVKNAKRRSQPGKLMDIAVADGRIAAVEPRLDGTADTTIDAGGKLVTESFVNTHLHLCKVYTLFMMDEAALKDYHAEGMGKAMTAIELAARVKEQYDQSWIVPNVRQGRRPIGPLRRNPHPCFRRCGQQGQAGRRQGLDRGA